MRDEPDYEEITELETAVVRTMRSLLRQPELIGLEVYNASARGGVDLKRNRVSVRFVLDLRPAVVDLAPEELN